MEKSLPDKWIRKVVYDLVDGITVNSEDIYVYDTKITGVLQPDFYVIMSTQTNEVNKFNKCEYLWDSELLLDVRATYQRAGNTGSRVQVDDMLDAVRNLVKDIQLDVSSGLVINKRILSFPNDLTEENDSEIIYRKFLRLTLSIE